MSFVTFADQLLLTRQTGAGRAGGLIVVEQVDSTQALARRVIDEYVRDGSLPPATDVVAWRQTSGRGRHQRTWSSPPGYGVYATLVRVIQAKDLQKLPLLGAVALADAVNTYLDGRCRLKWPNDLVVSQSKLGGLIIETISQEENDVVVSFGFGVNYSPDLQGLAQRRATSLSHEIDGEAPSLASFTADLLAALGAALGEDSPQSQVVERYKSLVIHEPGDEMRCQLEEGLVEGRFLGFDEHGFLRLQVGSEERVLTSGEILTGG